MSFQVLRRPEKSVIELFPRERKCLHHYRYLVDPEIGFMLVRIQGWIPCECQITSAVGRGWPANSTAPASARVRLRTSG
jgi:hypothetical protein